MDTGGTFTDACLLTGQDIQTVKVLSTPDDPSRAVAECVDALGGADLVIHGTTVATNALLEDRLGKTVHITTKGFRDVLATGRQQRHPDDLYSMAPRQRNELIPRQRRLEINERIGPNGEIEHALTDREIQRIIKTVKRQRPESVSVCLLHSYANGDHERRLGNALISAGFQVTLSCDLAPEFREYERSLVTAANAALVPVVSPYIEKLRARLGDVRVVLMHSSAGWLPPDIAAREPIRLALSGPAGGVVGAQSVLRTSGIERGLAFDVGGTSTDISVVTTETRLRSVTEVAGLPLRTPSLEIETIGAGGGSIASFDSLGGLNVGPRSAGATPGPACYDKGGKHATLTDALVVLGRIPATLRLGGRMAVRKDLAETALRRLSKTYTPYATAKAVLQVALANIERAIRRVTIQRGLDVSSMALVPFGGAGGVLACDLAELLGMATVLVPRHPGLLSAAGMLAAPASRDLSRTVLGVADDDDVLMNVAESLVQSGENELRDSGVTGRMKVRQSLDVRYRGQSFELNVPLRRGWQGLFHREHDREFGYSNDTDSVEVVNVRVRVEAPISQRRTKSETLGRSKSVEISSGEIERDDIPVGATVRGASIVTEMSSCLYVGKGWSATMEPSGSLLLKREAQ